MIDLFAGIWTRLRRTNRRVDANAGLPAPPAIDSEWEHKNGIVYRVMLIANQHSINDDYPITVVYQGVRNGKIWCRPLSRWYGSMKPYIHRYIAGA